jgi:hypothetical protein
VGRWQLLDVGKESSIERPIAIEEKKIAKRAFVEAICYLRMQAKSCDRIAKDKGRSNPGVIEESYAEVVACAEKLS